MLSFFDYQYLYFRDVSFLNMTGSGIIKAILPRCFVPQHDRLGDNKRHASEMFRSSTMMQIVKKTSPFRSLKSQISYPNTKKASIARFFCVSYFTGYSLKIPSTTFGKLLIDFSGVWISPDPLACQTTELDLRSTASMIKWE